MLWAATGVAPPETIPAPLTDEPVRGGLAPPAGETYSEGYVPSSDPPDTKEGGPPVLTGDGIILNNKAGIDVDVEDLIARVLSFGAGGKVLIIHTHGSEAYTPEPGWEYEASDPYRTEDAAMSVMRVGDALAARLRERGIDVVHDKGLYDYPSYTGSYTRSLEAVKRYLSADGGIKVVIDLHRDALEGKDGTVYKTLADVGEEPCSQIMLVAGTNASGLSHPLWRDNMAFALKLQAAMMLNYPSLARPLEVSRYRYNQHVLPGSLLVEVGCSGNTLRQSISAAEYFADCLADVLTWEDMRRAAADAAAE